MKFILRLLAALVVAGTGAIGEEPGAHGHYWSLEELDSCYVAQVARLRALNYQQMFGGSAEFELYFRTEEVSHMEDAEDDSEIMLGPFFFGPFRHQEPEKFKIVDIPEGPLHVNLRAAAPIWVDDGNVPLLIVVPECRAPLRWQTKHAKIGGIMSDVPDFDFSQLRDTVTDVPRDRPYLIYNVNLGAETVRTSLGIAEWEFKEAKRRGLTFAEGLALLQQYPDAVKCEQGVDEDHREHFALGHPVFLGTNYGSPCRFDKTLEEFIVFIVRKETVLSRGNFLPIIRRDMQPNSTRFLFPSCALAPATEVK